MKTNLSPDIVVMIVSVIICALLNVLGYHLYRVSGKVEISRLPRFEAGFFSFWKYAFGPILITLASIPAIIPRILHNFLGFNISAYAHSGAYIFTSLISYPILFIAYLIYVMKIEK
jgi:hypothetical protein